MSKHTKIKGVIITLLGVAALIVFLQTPSSRRTTTNTNEWIKNGGLESSVKGNVLNTFRVFDPNIQVVFTYITTKKTPDSEGYTTTVYFNLITPDWILRERRLVYKYITGMKKQLWPTQETMDILFEEIVNKKLKAAAEKYARESLEGTPIVYKRIGGLRKESEGKYTIAVIVDVTEDKEAVFILEIDTVGQQSFIGWDTKSAAFLTLNAVR